MTAPFDPPIRLAEACTRFFGGAMTVSGLRREAARGNLALTRIAGKDFVTESAIREMIEKCRVVQPQPASGSALTQACGSSRPVASVSPRDALRLKLDALRQPSGTGLPSSISRNAVAAPNR